jgi:glycoprotein-N-acetylgalactosamine 3-beta-galactosyltransferase
MYVPKGYHSGGASYVLSRESLNRFYDAHQDPTSKCRKDGGSEDIEIAQCLRRRGVYPGKSLDKENRELFHPLNFADHFGGAFPDWLSTYAETPPQSVSLCFENRVLFFNTDAF